MSIEDQGYYKRLITALLVTLLIYVFLFHTVSGNFLITRTLQKKTQPPREVEVIPVNRPRQIVDVPRVKNRGNARPRYLSTHAQRVPENMIAPSVGAPANRQPKSAPPPSSARNTGEKAKGSKGVKERIKSLLPPLIASNVSTQDNLIKEKVGPFTLISTAPSPIASFVISQGRRVLRVLQENISNYTWYYNDITRFVNNAEVKVTFSGNGNIIDTQLIRSSGSPKIDWVFLKSVEGGVVEESTPDKKQITLIFTLGKDFLKISVEDE